MVHLGCRGITLGLATMLAATYLRDRSFTNPFVQSFATPLRALVPERAPEQGVLPRGCNTCSSHGSKALFAACVFLAAASRQRIGRSSRHAEEGDARSNSEKGNRKNHSEKALTDEVVEELDSKMVDCAEAGDYAGAARLRDQLCAAQLDDEASVLQANVEFYAAFSQRDLERMKACWLQSAAQCIHPYDKTSCILKGFSEISDSFKRVFEESKTKNRLVSDEVKVNLRGATAVVTCQEKIVNNKKVQSILMATHVFRRGPSGKWQLMHRHASKPPGESLIFNADETNAWNARLQQLMRAAQSLGPGGSQFIINAANPMYDEEDGDDGDSPFGRMTATIEEVEGEDSSDDEPHDDELYVEEDETVMEESREAWRALRKLAVQGWITGEEKIELLANMLENPGESMVEKAHRLLLSDVLVKEESSGWEDFAEVISLQARRLKSASKEEKDEGKD